LSNPPDTLTLVSGSPQTAQLDSGFAAPLAVTLANSNGCPVTTGASGVPVMFSAPSSGASALFSSSASTSATVGTDASGSASAATFTANGAAGSYTVTASSPYGSVSFALTNTATGVPASIVERSPASESAVVTTRYAQALEVEVLDADGSPVVGASVSFTLDSSDQSECATTSTASATFVGGGAQAFATTDASGTATSPGFSANSANGAFTATAAISSAGGSANGTAAAATGNASPVSFGLDNLAGAPASLSPGVAARESALAGARFAIPLALTVTDAEHNPVAGASVTFTAPSRGASGRFAVNSGRHRLARRRRVTVKTDACGVAVAPPFRANDHSGGYIVKATVDAAKPAAFALVNQRQG
jgi:adhesin/invasin